MGPNNPWSPNWRPDPTGRRLVAIRAARRGALLAGIAYIPLAPPPWRSPSSLGSSRWWRWRLVFLVSRCSALVWRRRPSAPGSTRSWPASRSRSGPGRGGDVDRHRGVRHVQRRALVGGSRPRRWGRGWNRLASRRDRRASNLAPDRSRVRWMGSARAAAWPPAAFRARAGIPSAADLTLARSSLDDQVTRIGSGIVRGQLTSGTRQSASPGSAHGGPPRSPSSGRGACRAGR